MLNKNLTKQQKLWQEQIIQYFSRLEHPNCETAILSTTEDDNDIIYHADYVDLKADVYFYFKIKLSNQQMNSVNLQVSIGQYSSYVQDMENILNYTTTVKDCADLTECLNQIILEHQDLSAVVV